MLIQNHEVFVAPEGSRTLWRYMDFTKLISLLEDRALVFPRTDLFEDPYEGLLPEAAVRALRADPSPYQLSPAHAELWLKHPEVMRRQLYVSCWFASAFESAAMWKLYLSSSVGIAIRTSCDALAEALESCPYTVGLSAVRYIDYETTSIPFDNTLFPVMHKRMSFLHEQEVRAVIWSEISDNEPLIPKGAMHVSVPINPSQLIEAVHVSPSAPLWFGQLVEKVSARYALHAPVVRSNLLMRPTY